ncbi:hypothetical protein BKA69DRAFT_1122678 [Paraphysoderma sedebokerense]|nr:hypothetical protein BKA69DRAFT_1122678 [Paraphysoderma sedebokerense]
MSDSISAAQLKSFLLNYSFVLVCATAVLIFILFFCFQTPKSKRWNVPFNLGLCLLILTLAYFVASASFQIFSLTASFGQKSLLMNILVPIHLTVGELCLSYMVYRIYPQSTFRRILLPIIVVSILFRLATNIWANVNFMTDKGTVVPGILYGIGLMWNCSFFSSLFIYRYRKKLRASLRASRQLHSLLTFAMQTAIIPTLLIVPLVVLTFIPKTPDIVTPIVLLNILFVFAFGTLIAYPLFLLNYQANSTRTQSADLERFKTIHHTALQFVTSFGLERRMDSILDVFLRQIHAIFGGDMGYFVEQNRYGQISVVCGFSFRQLDSGEVETAILDANDLPEDIPMALLEHGLLLDEAKIKTFDGLWQNQDEIDLYLQDISSNMNSVLLLPLKFPGVSKKKLIYLERHEPRDSDSTMIDVQTLELLAGQLVAALDGARLFSQLEETNRNLENKINQRTAELELKNKLLQDAKQQALQAAEAKAVFLSNMSHEIRTPISQVILAAEMLCDTDIGSEGLENAQIIVNSSRFLLSLVNDILDVSKLESGKVVIQNLPFNLFETIQITVDAFAVDKDVRLAYYIPSNLPHFVVGDEIRIRQIITNLVSNAIKFTQHGYVLVRPTLLQDMYDAGYFHVKFEVIDTGSGIAEENIAKIFKRFEQESDSTTRTYGGTGLGLSICQNLCTLMGSTITVSSKLNHGSTFEFSIKFEKPPRNTSEKSSIAHVLKGQSKILLLEEPKPTFNNRSVLALQLETMGALIDSRSLSYHNEVNTYDMIVIDLSSCNHSIDHIYSKNLIPPELPVVVIHTKYQQSSVDEFIKSANLNLFTLIHPYKQSSLYRLIQNVLSPSTSDTNIEALAVKSNVLPVNYNSPETTEADLKILLAEDNLVNQTVFRTMMSKLGYTIDIAENGKVAVDMCMKKSYDIIFMDMRMPVMDGLEATRRIRSCYSSFDSLNTMCESEEPILNPEFIAAPKPLFRPVIIGLSADVMPENQNEGLEAGMDMYFPKPLSKIKLLEVLDQIVDNRNLIS